MCGYSLPAIGETAVNNTLHPINNNVTLSNGLRQESDAATMGGLLPRKVDN